MTRAAAPGGFRVTTSGRDDLIVLHVAGDLDYPHAPVLRQSLEQALASEPPRILVDLACSGFVDSTGLALFLHTFQPATARAGWLRNAVAGTQFRRLPATTTLDRRLPPYASVDAAANAS